MLLEEAAKENIANKTHYYWSVESEKRQYPRRHDKYRYLGWRYPRQRKTVESDTFFTTIKHSLGNTCPQFLLGLHLIDGVYTP